MLLSMWSLELVIHFKEASKILEFLLFNKAALKFKNFWLKYRKYWLNFKVVQKNIFFVTHIFHHLIYKNVEPKTNTKGQATQHGDGDKGIEIVYDEEKKYLLLGRLEQPRQNKNLLYLHDKPNEPTKRDLFHLSSLSPHSPSVSTVSRGHPLSSLSV